MSISLADIKTSTLGPPRVVIYGVAGIGKSTLASYSPSPIFIPVEDGIAGVDAFPRPESYDQIIECVNELLVEKHSYKTLVVDGLDTLEPKLWRKVCVAREKAAIEDFGYGKGFEYALDEWRNLLEGFDALRTEKGMAITLVAHSAVVKVEPPDTVGYDRYQLQIHKKADACIRGWADVVGFVNYKVVPVKPDKDDTRRIGAGTGERTLFLTERPAHCAKNRYGFPDSIPIPPKDKGEAVMAELWTTMLGKPAAPASKKKATASAAT